MILEKILIMTLLGLLLWTLDGQEKRIQDLDRRVTKLENIASNNCYWKNGVCRCR